MTNEYPCVFTNKRTKSVKLAILSGSRTGEKIRFAETATIGRTPADNRICIPDESVSSRHGQIEWVGDRVMLCDLGSTNGTACNGVSVQEAELHDGDEIALGDVHIKVTLEEGTRGEGRGAEEREGARDEGRGLEEKTLADAVASAPSVTKKTHAAKAPVAVVKPKARAKKVLLSVAALIALAGIGLAVRFATRHKNTDKTDRTVQAVQPIATGTVKKEDWNKAMAAFKPEGDAAAKAQQRMAFIKGLLIRFPDDKEHGLSARLELAAWHESQKQYKDAVEWFESFLKEAPDKDSRRVQARSGAVRCWAFLGDAKKMTAAFDPLCQENFKEAVILAQKISAQLAGGDKWERGRTFCAAAFDTLCSRLRDDKVERNTWSDLTEFGRISRHICAHKQMEELKDREPWDKNDEPRMLKGIVGGMRSVDVFAKALSIGGWGYYSDKMTPAEKEEKAERFIRLVGEGCNVNGDYTDHSYIIASQYPCKADLFLNWYAKTGFSEYRDCASGFILRLRKLYRSSKDKDGKHWLPIGQFLNGDDGREYGYSDAPKLETWRDVYKFDQSGSKHNTHNAYMDAWGLGMWELAKSAKYLEPQDRTNLVEVLNGFLDFCHRPYVLKDTQNAYFWRTDAFSPLGGPTDIPEPDWAFLGLDVIHAVLALDAMGEDTRPWQESLKKFAGYYMRERPRHSDEKLVEYTDLRAMDLADFLEKECKDATLSDWLRKNIGSLYAKRETPVCVVPDGKCLRYSPLPVMELFARYAPGRFKAMWQELLRDHVTPRGIFQNGEFPDINESEHEGILDITITGWRAKLLTDGEFKDAVEKMFLMWGNPRSSLSMEDWVMAGTARDRQRRGWTAEPYPGYPENVRPEGYYAGMPQGYTMTFTSVSVPQPVDEYNSIENSNVNILFQYTSPGGHHTERLRFGRMATFNLFDTHDRTKQKLTEEKDKKILEVECVTPDVPQGTPCAGMVKVTEVYCTGNTMMTPTGYEVTRVLHNGKETPFVVSAVFGYNKPPCINASGPIGKEDCVKVCFLLRADKAGQAEKIKIIFDKVF
jgi:hypothetical protein